MFNVKPDSLAATAVVLLFSIFACVLSGCQKGLQEDVSQVGAVSLFDFEGKDIPVEAIAENVDFALVEGAGVTSGQRALAVRYSTETLYKKVFFEVETAWDFSELGDCSLVFEVTNTSTESAQLFLTVKDTAQSVTSHVNIAAGKTGTYYMDLANSNQALNLGMTGWPSRVAAEVGGGTPFQYAWGTRVLDLASIQHIGLFLKGNLTERELIFDNLRIVSNPKGDTSNLKSLVDAYGQYTGMDWKDKIHGPTDLQEQAEEERSQLAVQSDFIGRSKFGGWLDGPRLEATGFFRAEKVNGIWSLVDPDGYLYFANGVANNRFSNTYTVTGVDYDDVENKTGIHVTSKLRREMFQWLPEMEDPLSAHYSYASSIHTGAVKKGQTYSFYRANLQRKYGPEFYEIWGDRTLDRMQSWGFTCLGNWNDPIFYKNGRMPYFAHGWIRGEHKRVSTGNDYWGPIHDPFDPQFARSVQSTVTQLDQNIQGDPWCVGIFIDNEISWGNNYSDQGRYGIVIHTLGRKADECPAKDAFLALLRERYKSIENLNASWGVEIPSWEVFAAGYQNQEELSDTQRADYAMLSEALISEYFKVVNRELKKVMPNHLYCGARFADWGLTEDAIQAAAKHTDVISYNLYTEGLPGHFGEWLEEIDRPSLLGEVHFGATDRGMFHGGICTASDQEDRGVKHVAYVKSVLRSPYFVGTHWFQYVDSPTTGRAIDGENYNSGFVSVTDTPYAPLVEAAREVNRQLYKIRFEGLK
ncbi:MAG: beta-galactosidase [Coraliomargaritaceae bacterium]